MHALKNNSRTKIALLSFFKTGARFLWHHYKVAKYLHVKTICISHRIGSFVLILFFSIFCVYASASTQVYKIVESIGFSIDKVNIIGNRQTAAIDILETLNVNSKTSIIGFSVRKAHAALHALPWIASVSIRKIYPNQIRIAIIERCPVALWQHDNTVDIVDREGHVIMPYTPGYDLPLFVGKGAEDQVGCFLDAMKFFQSIAAHVRAYIRVGERRWDLLLDSGVRIKLPEVNAFKRLAMALKIADENRQFFRNVEIIDLRLDDRITLALSGEAMHRLAAVKDLKRQQKKTRKAGEI